MTVRLCFILFALGCSIAHAQLNVQLVGQLDYEPTLSSLWGYTAPDGTEYALVGHTSGLSIVSLADPANPVELQFIPAVQSIWRELKTWGNFAYVVQDVGQQGMLIVDLSTLPQDTAAYLFWRPDIPTLGLFNRAHTIWIDEFGLAYLNGSNLGGCLVVDVKPDPWNPQYLASMPLDYAHDVYVRDSILYSAEIYIGQMGVYDLSNLADIRFLGSVTTPYAFTHNTWLSDDGKTVFTTDERSNAFVGSYDVSDPANIRELDRFRPAKTVGRGVIPHNVHVWDDYVITAYYTDGCIIMDASRPDNLIEIGNFDTYLGPDGGFSGAWGAYPFFPSGNIIISDRQNGLFVLAPQYVRGCYLEGDVRSAVTGLPIINAQVEIILPDDDETEVILPDHSDLEGVFKMGKAVPGTFTIVFSHPDYITQEVQGEFVNGEVLELHIVLEPKPTHTVGGRVLNAIAIPVVVPFAYVALESEDRLYQTQADAQGQYMFPAIIEGPYRLYAGNWGMYLITEWDVMGPVTADIYLRPGYYDDFLNDLGWTVSGTSIGAQWERGAPVSELLFGQYQCNPSEDIADDFGPNAFVTGNAGGDAAEDDVEGGYTLLSSPVMDLSSYNEPVVSYYPWICERLIEEQVYFVLVSNGTDTVAIDTITTFDLGGDWQTREIPLKPFIELTDQMQVHFLAQDLGTDNVIKAALDVVIVFDANPSSTRDETNLDKIRIYPNPSSGKISVEFEGQGTADQVTLFSVFGQEVWSKKIANGSISLDLTGLNPGVYIVQMSGDGQVLGVGRVVLQ